MAPSPARLSALAWAIAASRVAGADIGAHRHVARSDHARGREAHDLAALPMGYGGLSQAPHGVMRREAESGLLMLRPAALHRSLDEADESLMQEIAQTAVRQGRAHSGAQQASANPWRQFAADAADSADADVAEDPLDTDEPAGQPAPRAVRVASQAQATDEAVLESEAIAVEADKLKEMIEDEAGVPGETMEEEVEKKAEVKHADEREALVAMICVISGIVGSLCCCVGSLAWLGAITWSNRDRGKDAGWDDAQNYDYDPGYDAAYEYDQAYGEGFAQADDQIYAGDAAEGASAEGAEAPQVVST
mmetsp:Transcript_47671/g.132735  ORF Transcript_47671/g.132735 Transcript_47671/m.132735 type:complete len:306 (+) Transcript_47671:94-1011(+)